MPNSRNIGVGHGALLLGGAPLLVDVVKGFTDTPPETWSNDAMIGGKSQSGILFQVVAAGVAVGRSWKKWRRVRAGEAERFKEFFRAELEGETKQESGEGPVRQPSPRSVELVFQPGRSQQAGHALRL